MLSRHAITDTRLPISDDLRAVIEILQARPWTGQARAAEAEMLAALTAAGFTGRVEQHHQFGTRAGRLNLVVARAGEPIAIEIDQPAPRAKSIAKLRAFKGERLLLLLIGKSARPTQVHGIHRVIGVAVAKQTAPAATA